MEVKKLTIVYSYSQRINGYILQISRQSVEPLRFKCRKTVKSVPIHPILRYMFQLSGKSTAASSIQFFSKVEILAQIMSSRQSLLWSKPIDTVQVFQARKIKKKNTNEKKFKITCYLSLTNGEEIEHKKKKFR